ncbi:hypothetical protein PaeBR_10665 [Paenibacillus sp. BR2-3]|uniref:hypothetical protein n=1 Tax=Paenibacillus sp. BR2-3 TaxID=3048494 RepID=UPI003977C1EA
MSGLEMRPGLLEALRNVSGLLSFDWEEKPPLWLLGGSCGLLLHGVPLEVSPRDIDLYADLGEADVLHSALSKWALNHPEEDWSRGCFSLRSQYRLEEYSAELVCGFKVCFGLSQYTVETSLLLQDAPRTYFEGIGHLRLMPLAHEFVFNVMRGRRDRYEGIAAVMRKNLANHLPLLQTLIDHNLLEQSHVLLIEELLAVSLSHELERM